MKRNLVIDGQVALLEMKGRMVALDCETVFSRNRLTHFGLEAMKYIASTPYYRSVSIVTPMLSASQMRGQDVDGELGNLIFSDEEIDAMIGMVDTPIISDNKDTDGDLGSCGICLDYTNRVFDPMFGELCPLCFSMSLDEKVNAIHMYSARIDVGDSDLPY